MAIEELLKVFEDYLDWNKLIQACDTLNGLSEFEREQSKKAFQFLSKELGEQFLKERIVTGHPFLAYITNNVPWTRRRIIWFAQALRAQKNNQGYESLIERLKDERKYLEGESVLEVADKLSKVGFEITFDRKLMENERKPDLRIINNETGEGMFVEVSIQNQSTYEKQAMDNQEAIMLPLLRSNPYVYSSGRIYKVLSERHLQEVTERIQKLVKDAQLEESFQQLIIEDTLELAVAPEKDIRLLEKWAESKNLHVGQLEGPSININELQRTHQKIAREAQQLPRDSPHLLVIKSNGLFNYGSADINAVISELEESVYRFPYVYLTVLSANFIGKLENGSLIKGQHVYLSKESKNGTSVEQVILLFNQYCNFKVTPATMCKISKAFGQY